MMNQQGPKIAKDPLSNRACDACRAHKVRCLPNTSSQSKICQRCAKTDRECHFSPFQKRKQRKRTDTRVAELEREVQAMRTLFDSKATVIREKSPIELDEQNNERTASNSEGSARESGVQGVSLTPEINFPSQNGSPFSYSLDTDVVDRGIISLDAAYNLFDSYNQNLVHHFPGVIFSADTTAEECRRTKPTLFLAIIAAAAAQTAPRLYSILNTEVLTAYAHRTVMRQEKNLELVQAMIVTSVW
jgi:hypothetical protein